MREIAKLLRLGAPPGRWVLAHGHLHAGQAADRGGAEDIERADPGRGDGEPPAARLGGRARPARRPSSTSAPIEVSTRSAPLLRQHTPWSRTAWWPAHSSTTSRPRSKNASGSWVISASAALRGRRTSTGQAAPPPRACLPAWLAPPRHQWRRIRSAQVASSLPQVGMHAAHWHLRMAPPAGRPGGSGRAAASRHGSPRSPVPLTPFVVAEGAMAAAPFPPVSAGRHVSGEGPPSGPGGLARRAPECETRPQTNRLASGAIHP